MFPPFPIIDNNSLLPQPKSSTLFPASHFTAFSSGLRLKKDDRGPPSQAQFVQHAWIPVPYALLDIALEIVEVDRCSSTFERIKSCSYVVKVVEK